MTTDASLESSDNLSKLQQRIAGRKMGETLFELIEGDTTNLAYMDSLCAELCKNVPKPKVDLGPLERYGGTIMPFGQYQGKTFDECPIDYLDWLCGVQEDFLKTLRAYLKHPSMKR
jgi:hypothetical protein